MLENHPDRFAHDPVAEAVHIVVAKNLILPTRSSARSSVAVVVTAGGNLRADNLVKAINRRQLKVLKVKISPTDDLNGAAQTLLYL